MLIDQAHDEARAILVTHRATLDALAIALIERETVEDVELAELFKDIDVWPGLKPEEERAPVEPPSTPPIPIPAHAAEPATRPAAVPAPSRWGRVWRRAPRPSAP
jgi:cell division protease FtsH